MGGLTFFFLNILCWCCRSPLKLPLVFLILYNRADPLKLGQIYPSRPQSALHTPPIMSFTTFKKSVLKSQTVVCCNPHLDYNLGSWYLTRIYLGHRCKTVITYSIVTRSLLKGNQVFSEPPCFNVDTITISFLLKQACRPCCLFFFLNHYHRLQVISFFNNVLSVEVE